MRMAMHLHGLVDMENWPCGWPCICMGWSTYMESWPCGWPCIIGSQPPMCLGTLTGG